MFDAEQVFSYFVFNNHKRWTDRSQKIEGSNLLLKIKKREITKRKT